MGPACINCGVATLPTIARPWEMVRQYNFEGLEIPKTCHTRTPYTATLLEFCFSPATNFRK